MKISFEKVPQDLLGGIREVSNMLGIEQSGGGIPVKAVPDADMLTVKYENGAARISYSKRVEFFRGLSLKSGKKRPMTASAHCLTIHATAF